MAFQNLVLTLLVAVASHSEPQLWYFQHNDSGNEQSVETGKALIDRAVAAGYTGVVVWDGSFDLVGEQQRSEANEARLRSVLDYAASHGLKILATAAPFAYSVNALRTNPNLAESQRILGARFQVDPTGTRLNFIDSFAGLGNSSFESGQDGWSGTHDAGIGVDRHVAHSGQASGVIAEHRGNARFRQRIKLKPWRQYRLRLFYKSRYFRGFAQLEIIDAADASKIRFNAPLAASGSQDWKQLDYTFNSRDTADAFLYFGVWGSSSGTLWFDDVQLAETALVYVTRRPSTPVRVYDPAHPTTVFQERLDYDVIADPHMADATPFTDSYHDPAPVGLPAGTRLKPGQIVAIDFYSVFPIPRTNQVSMCLSDPGVANWLKQNAQGLNGVLPSGSGLLLEYDEIRQMNSCGSCRAKHFTAGQLLAWSVGQTVRTYRSAMPDVPLYIWSDMFDPYHNAVSHYYYVEGDLAGSWRGLPSSVTVMNWNLDRLERSLTWFSGLDRQQPIAYRQIIAGFYDNGSGAEAARQELQQAAGIPGIDGLMYTTWTDDYSQLEAFAAAAKAAWPAYLAHPRRSASAILQGHLWQWAVLIVLLAAAILSFRPRRT